MGQVRHVVLYRATPGHEQALAEALAACGPRLVAEIPGFLAFSSGRDFSGRAGGFTNCIVALFADRGALEARVAYDAHRVLRASSQPHFAETIVFDFDEP